MDGEVTRPVAPAYYAPERPPAPEAREARPLPSRAKRVRWFVIVALLVALVLGGLYGFNAYRNKMIANFFAAHGFVQKRVERIVSQHANRQRRLRVLHVEVLTAKDREEAAVDHDVAARELELLELGVRAVRDDRAPLVHVAEVTRVDGLAAVDVVG